MLLPSSRSPDSAPPESQLNATRHYVVIDVAASWHWSGASGVTNNKWRPLIIYRTRTAYLAHAIGLSCSRWVLFLVRSFFRHTFFERHRIIHIHRSTGIHCHRDLPNLVCNAQIWIFFYWNDLFSIIFYRCDFYGQVVFDGNSYSLLRIAKEAFFFFFANFDVNVFIFGPIV